MGLQRDTTERLSLSLFILYLSHSQFGIATILVLSCHMWLAHNDQWIEPLEDCEKLRVMQDWARQEILLK